MKERHTIKYIVEYKNKKYNVVIEKPKELNVSVYLGHYIFYSELKNPNMLKYWKNLNGPPTQKNLEELRDVRVISITEDITLTNSLFKENNKHFVGEINEQVVDLYYPNKQELIKHNPLIKNIREVN